MPGPIILSTVTTYYKDDNIQKDKFLATDESNFRIQERYRYYHVWVLENDIRKFEKRSAEITKKRLPYRVCPGG
jgi:hypothetical protein